MKVINNISNVVPFVDLTNGQVFYDHCGNWYLRCESVMCEEYKEPVNAVSLENGELEFFDMKQEVWPVVGNFVAESIGLST